MENNILSPEEQARNLYLQLGLTQEQIAQIVDVSQKTISLWMNQGKWKTMKQIAAQSPTVLVEQMNCELLDLNNLIQSRDPGKRHPTVQEAETRRKIIFSINILKKHQGISANIEVMMNFINYVMDLNFTDAKFIHKYADRYIQDVVAAQGKIGETPYEKPVKA